MMDYSCGKFGDFSFSHFGCIVWTNAAKCITPATVVVVIKFCITHTHRPVFPAHCGFGWIPTRSRWETELFNFSHLSDYTYKKVCY